MQKWKWVAYGLDMDEDIFFETEGLDIHEAHKNALEELKTKGISNWDTLELEDSLKERMERKS